LSAEEKLEVAMAQRASGRLPAQPRALGRWCATRRCIFGDGKFRLSHVQFFDDEGSTCAPLYRDGSDGTAQSRPLSTFPQAAKISGHRHLERPAAKSNRMNGLGASLERLISPLLLSLGVS
jgi:hypothetical protein